MHTGTKEYSSSVSIYTVGTSLIIIADMIKYKGELVLCVTVYECMIYGKAHSVWMYDIW